MSIDFFTTVTIETLVDMNLKLLTISRSNLRIIIY